MVRIEPTAEASLAAIRERSRFGMAMAAMIRMIATTISNSISEKPFWFFFTWLLLLNLDLNAELRGSKKETVLRGAFDGPTLVQRLHNLIFPLSIEVSNS